MARGHGSRLPNRDQGSKADFIGQASRVLAALGAAPLIRSLMAEKSAIEWTEAMGNPTTGCDRISSLPS
jgi:hypothetical protein